MGMFDNIKCLYPLPGNPPFPQDEVYQTKDLDCSLDFYTISVDGDLDYPNYTGDICFYTSNIRSSGPGIYTKDGADAISVEYRAKFVDSKLVEIKEESLVVLPALPVSDNRVYQDCNEEYPDWTPGTKRVYVLWGGIDPNRKGYYGEVICESFNQICIKIEDGDNFHRSGELETIDIRGWGTTIFLDEKDAFAHRDARQASWDRYKKIYDEYSEEWNKKREIANSMSEQRHSGFAQFPDDGKRSQFVNALLAVDAKLKRHAYLSSSGPTIVFERLTDEDQEKVLCALKGLGRWVEDIQFGSMG